MAVDIGPKIGMDGEAEFRKELNNINTALRTLGTEMQKVTSEFSDNANGQQALIAKNETLNKTIDATRRKLEQANKALSEAEKKYGATSNEALKWQQVVNRTETSLNKLESELDQNTSALEEMDQGLRDAETGLKNVQEEADDTAESLSFGDLVGANAVVEGIKSISSAMMETVEETKEYRKIMSSLEVSSQNAGYSAEETAQSYRQLYGVLADDQTAATTTANLQAMGLSQKELTDLTNGAIGAWATYGDSIPIDGLAEAINETAKVGTVTGTFADVLNWAGTSEDKFNEKLAECSSESDRAKLILQELTNQGLIKAGEAWQQNNKDLVESNLATADFTDTMARLAEKISPVTTAVQDGFNDILSTVTDLTENVDFSKIAQGVDEGFSFLTEEIIPKVIDFGGFLMDNKDTIISSVVGIGAGFLTWKVGTIVSGIAGVISGTTTLSAVLPGVAKAIQAVNTAMKSNPIVLVVSLIATLVSAIITLWATNEDFRNAVIDIATKVADVVAKAVDSVIAFFSNLASTVKQIWNNIKTTVTTFVTNILDTITTTFWNIVNTVTETLKNVWNTIQNIWNTIKEFVTNTVNTILNTITTTFWNIVNTIIQTLQNVWNTVSNIWLRINTFLATTLASIFSTLSNVFWNIVSTIAQTLQNAWNTVQNIWNSIKSFISNAASSAWNAISNAFWNIVSTISSTLQNAWGTVQNIWNSIKNFISNAVSNIVSRASDGFWNMVDGIRNAVGNVYDVVAGGFQGAIDFITSLPGQAVGWGQDFIQGLIDGISNMIGSVVDKVKDVADTISSYLHFSVPDVGPLRDAPNWMPDMIDLMVDGIKKSEPKLDKTLQSMSRSMAKSIELDPVITARQQGIDYDRLERMQSKGIYLNGRLVGREFREMGFVMQ